MTKLGATYFVVAAFSLRA